MTSRGTTSSMTRAIRDMDRTGGDGHDDCLRTRMVMLWWTQRMGELVIVVIHLAVIAKVLLLLLLLTQTRILFRTIWDRETIRTVFHFCVSSWPDEVGSFSFLFFFWKWPFLSSPFIYLFILWSFYVVFIYAHVRAPCSCFFLTLHILLALIFFFFFYTVRNISMHTINSKCLFSFFLFSFLYIYTYIHTVR